MPLEEWLKVPVQSTPGVRLPAAAEWKDVFRDAEGELPAHLAKAAPRGVSADVVRQGRLQVGGFEAAPRGPSSAELRPEAAQGPWRLLARFRPVQPIQVEHLEFAPGGSWLSVSLQTNKVVGLDLMRRRERLLKGGEAARSRFFAFTAAGQPLIKQVTPEGSTEVLDAETGKSWAHLHSATSTTFAGPDHVAAPGGGRVMVAVGATLQLRNFATFTTLAKLRHPETKRPFVYRTGCFSADGRRLRRQLRE